MIGMTYIQVFFRATIRSKQINVPRKLPTINAPCSPATSPMGMDQPILNSPDNTPMTSEISTKGKMKKIFLFTFSLLA